MIAASLSDGNVFAAIFDKHFRCVSTFLRRRAGASAAEELTSQTFLVAFASRSNFDQARISAKPWLLGIATNLVRHQARGVGRQRRAYDRATPDSEADFTEQAIGRADASGQRPALVAALSELTVEERDVLLLFAWGELSYEEIAEALEVPIGTVRSRLARARKRMEQLIDDSESEHEGVTARG